MQGATPEDNPCVDGRRLQPQRYFGTESRTTQKGNGILRNEDTTRIIQ